MVTQLTGTILSILQTRKTAGWLAGELSREGHQVALLSGEMQVEQRAAVIDRFRDGKEKVLVTTNVCARGKNQVLPVWTESTPCRHVTSHFFVFNKSLILETDPSTDLGQEVFIHMTIIHDSKLSLFPLVLHIQVLMLSRFLW